MAAVAHRCADPQGNASTGFGIKYDQRDKDLYSIICGKDNINVSKEL